MINEINVLEKSSEKKVWNCPCCLKNIKKGEKVMGVVKGVVWGNFSYNFYHYNCFLKEICKLCPDLLDNNKIKEIRKEILVEKL